MRWATKLSAFKYVTEYIPGEENVWADMLSRWGNHYNLGIRATRFKIGSLVLAPVSPSLSPEFDWPKMAEIVVQKHAPKDTTRVDVNGSAKPSGFVGRAVQRVHEHTVFEFLEWPSGGWSSDR